MMKNNKALIYALIISLAVHSVLVIYLFMGPGKEKKRKENEYTRPILVEPYNFIKNLEKHKINKPRLASIKPHYANKNTRLNAPYLHNNTSLSPAFNSPAPFSKKYAAKNNNIYKGNNNQKRIITNSHIFASNNLKTGKQNYNLNNPFAMDRFFNKNQELPQNNFHPGNPMEGVKSATVNLNTTTIKYASYLLHLKNKIENVWEYPEKARERDMSGELVIEFSINRDGSVYKVAVLRSSGEKILDSAAVKAIYDGAKYNPFPGYWTINRLNIIGTFIYRISGFYMH